MEIDISFEDIDAYVEKYQTVHRSRTGWQLEIFLILAEE